MTKIRKETRKNKFTAEDRQKAHNKMLEMNSNISALK